VSDTDSFIDEVSEEVRRDRLFRAMKKYGWIAILLVILLVGGAAFNEFRKSKARTEAQRFGDEILLALQADEPTTRLAALDDVATTGEKNALLGFVAAGEEVDAGQTDSAIKRLKLISSDASLSSVYRQLADLKLVLLQGEDLSTDERMARLEPLAIAGMPFRLLAEEQMALAEIASEDFEAALFRLQGILADGELTAGLRRRVSQLIVALGGELEQA